MRENCTYSLSGGRWLARKRATSDPTPMKPSNQVTGQSPAAAEDPEGTPEGRARTKENVQQARAVPAQDGAAASQGLKGVRKAARERKQERFTTLLHHLTVDLPRDRCYALKRDAAPGVDAREMGGIRRRTGAAAERSARTGAAGQLPPRKSTLTAPTPNCAVAAVRPKATSGTTSTPSLPSPLPPNWLRSRQPRIPPIPNPQPPALPPRTGARLTKKPAAPSTSPVDSRRQARAPHHRMYPGLANAITYHAGPAARIAAANRVLQCHCPGHLQYGRHRNLRHHGLHGGRSGQRAIDTGLLDRGSAVRAGGRGELFRTRHQFSQFGRRVCVSDPRLRAGVGIHDGVGLVFRRLLRAHCRRRAGLRRLPRLFFPRPEAGQRDVSIQNPFSDHRERCRSASLAFRFPCRRR